MNNSRVCRDCTGDLYAVGNDPNACTCEPFNETTAIFLDDGGYEDPRADYDERRCWFVTPGDDDGEPTGKSTTFYSRDEAFNFARIEAERLGVELVTE